MSASPESVSGIARAPGDAAGRVLICGVNWLGDSVMTMPAIRSFMQARPGVPVTLLVKRPWVALWSSLASVDEVLELGEGAAGVWRAARAVAARRFKTAYVFPNSVRSALVPCLAGVPERVGARGRCRVWLLSRVRAARPAGERTHQAMEYFDILGIQSEPCSLRMPCLSVPDRVLRPWREQLGEHFGSPRPPRVIAFLPGAARGPAKRWPAERFAEVGRRVEREQGWGTLVLGGANERDVCARVSEGIGRKTLNLAGRTSLMEAAAVLSVCDAAVTNDSGGMHLAAAVGTKVVAVFGLTDPAKTGPLGEGHRVIAAAGIEGARGIARDSAAARRALESIEPSRVYGAVIEAVGA